MRLKVRAVNCRHKNYNWQITLNKTFKLQLDESGRGKTLLALFSGSVPISQKKREPSKDKMNTRTWPETGTRFEAQLQTSSRRLALSLQTGRESLSKVITIIICTRFVLVIKMSQKGNCYRQKEESPTQRFIDETFGEILPYSWFSIPDLFVFLFVWFLLDFSRFVWFLSFLFNLYFRYFLPWSCQHNLPRLIFFSLLLFDFYSFCLIFFFR